MSDHTSDHIKWTKKLSSSQLVALNCILIAQKEIFTNGDTEHNLAIRKVISKIASEYKVVPRDSYKLLWLKD